VDPVTKIQLPKVVYDALAEELSQSGPKYTLLRTDQETANEHFARLAWLREREAYATGAIVRCSPRNMQAATRINRSHPFNAWARLRLGQRLLATIDLDICLGRL
jgi:hypothetical protein